MSISACWIITLISLVAKTANPVTLNRQQIDESDLIVKAHFSRSNIAAVDKMWKSNVILPSIDFAIVDVPPAVHVPSADFKEYFADLKEYIMPITKRLDGRYEITRVRMQEKIGVSSGTPFPFDGVITDGTTTVRIPDGEELEKTVNDRVLKGWRNIKNDVEVNALAPCYVYPANAETIEQLERMLREMKNP